MEYLDLVGSVGEDQENDPADIKSTAASLTKLGVGRMDRALQTGVWNGDFDGGVRHYQASNGLDVDGILLPGGPTQQSINDSLGFAEEPRAKRASATRENGFEADPPLQSAVFFAPSEIDKQERESLEPDPLHTREDRLLARGYRYRPDPMGRLGEGDWLDALGRPVGAAEVKKVESEAQKTLLPARPATIESLVPSTYWLTPAAAIPSAPKPDVPNGDETLADGGNAFARELLRNTKIEDFDEPSVYLDALETLPDEIEGVEPVGFRDELRKLLDAIRRRVRPAPKTPTGPPRPPAGAPPLPKAVTERLDHIKDPHVRNAANRLLDGAVVKGWMPRPEKLAPPAEVVKQGGEKQAFKDFAQFVGRAGGSKQDIKIHKNGTYSYVAPDKTRISFYKSENGPTNSIVIELPPGLRTSGRDGNTLVKIRYE